MDFMDWNWTQIKEELELAWVIGINYVLVLLLVFHILLENKNPQKTYAYILILFLTPVIGIFVYLTFGQNYRRNKMFNRKKITDKLSFQTLASDKIIEGRIDPEKIPPCAKTHSKVIHLLKNTSHSMLLGNNELQLLINGEKFFPELLSELEKASSHIHIEFYIFQDDELGNYFIEVLKKKAEEGVEVRFIYDAVGSLGLSNKALDSLKASGVKTFPFLPIRFPLFGSRINYRNHRKILVVDGKVGFTGGINIDKKYDNRCDNEIFWRDTGLRIKGNGVWTLQQIFMFDWSFCSDEDLEFREKYFPKITSLPKPIPLQIAASGPDSDWASIMQAYFSAINQAREEIRITTPYFVPNESIRNSLKTASMGGVRVELMIPYESDSRVVRMAMRSFFRGLLEAGVKIYQYKKGFVHAKTMTVDSGLASVGTANMDMRSFELNFEVNAFIYDPDFTRQLIDQFEVDKKDCTLLTLAEVKKWNILKRLTYSLARLFAPIL
jgi:cardiolipin synthase A/B